MLVLANLLPSTEKDIIAQNKLEQLKNQVWLPLKTSGLNKWLCYRRGTARRACQ